MNEILELKPKNQCKDYMVKNNVKIVVLLTKQEFDEYAISAAFVDGPYRDSFGDGHGDPYNPYRQAFGQLKIGYQSNNGMVTFVFSELVENSLDKSLAEKVKEKVKNQITNQGRLVSLVQGINDQLNNPEENA